MLAAKLSDRLNKALNEVLKDAEVQKIINQIKALSLFKGHALEFKIVSAKEAKMQDSIGPAIDERIVPLMANLITTIKKLRSGAANFAILVFNTDDKEPWLTIINETGSEVSITQRITPVVADLSMFKEYFRPEHNAPIQVALSVFTRYLEAGDRLIIQINDKQCNFRYVKSNEKTFSPAETTTALTTLGQLLASFTTEAITLSLHHSKTDIVEQFRFNAHMKAASLSPESPGAHGGAGKAVTTLSEPPDATAVMAAIAKEVDALRELVNFVAEIDAKKYSSPTPLKAISMSDDLATTIYELSKCISDLLGNRQIMIDFLSDKSVKLLEAEKNIQPTMALLKLEKLSLEAELSTAKKDLSEAQTEVLKLKEDLKKAQELINKKAQTEAKLRERTRELDVKIEASSKEIDVYKKQIEELQQKLTKQAKRKPALHMVKVSESALDYPPVARRALSTQSFPSKPIESTYELTLRTLQNNAAAALAQLKETQEQLLAMSNELAEVVLARDTLALEFARLKDFSASQAAEVAELRAAIPTAPKLVQVDGVVLEDGSWVPTFVLETSVNEARQRKQEQDAIAQQAIEASATSYPLPVYAVSAPMYAAYAAPAEAYYAVAPGHRT